MIVWPHQTIVWSRQTIVWREQTIVCCRQTMDDKGSMRQAISRTPLFIILKATNNQILIRRSEALKRGAADRRERKKCQQTTREKQTHRFPPRYLTSTNNGRSSMGHKEPARPIQAHKLPLHSPTDKPRPLSFLALRLCSSDPAKAYSALSCRLSWL